MIKLFGNIESLNYLEKILGDKIHLIKQPILKADANLKEIRELCKDQILEAITATTIILHCDYALCSLIAIDRSRLNKKTGFIAYENNRIVNIRWL